LPPSITMSPSSSNGVNSSITASVGAPALTMMMIWRGFCRLATSCSAVSAATKSPSCPCCSIKSLVLL
jgi:hypothetical protein